MEFTSDFWERFKCAVCKNYLNLLPIFLLKNGANICGRCNVPNVEASTALRNVKLEEIMQAVEFRCCWKKNGCTEMYPIGKLKFHESTCRFGTYLCPITISDMDCSWSGRLFEVRNHFESCHKSLTVKNLEIYQDGMSRNCHRTYYFNFQGFDFFVQMKYNAFLSSIWFCVLTSEDVSMNDKFSYKVDMIRATEVKCLKQAKVFHLGEYKLYGLQCGVDIPLKKSSSSVENICFKIGITVAGLYCSRCFKYESSSSSQSFAVVCESCCNRCPNLNLGCNFSIHDEFILKKHVTWLCKANKDKKFDFTKPIQASHRENVALINFLQPLEGSNKLVVEAHGVKFLLDIRIEKFLMVMILVANQPEISSRNFICKYSIQCIGTDSIIYGKFDPVDLSNLYTNLLLTDWSKTISIKDSHLSEIQQDDVCEFRFDFVKI